MTGLPPLALYVHMPWCVRKCPYCDFNSHELRRERPDARYVDALSRDFERELASIAGRTIQSVFFGGGTPSLFAAPEYARLLVQLRRQAPFAEDAEITLEANPGTVERGAFSAYRDAGINRVSLGAQTFDARSLSVLGRIHSPEETLRAGEELRAAKLDTFNLALMYGLPGQIRGEALADVATACALGSSHISHYQLTLEPGTVFHSRRPALPGEEVLWEMQTECQRLLADHGYAQYEVSAYARDGARCRHNLNYWRFGDYLGIGAGAHGKLSLELPGRVLRSVKPRMPGAYLAAACGTDASIGEREPILESSLPFEFMLNALRLNEGFRGADFEARTGLALARIEPKLQDAERRGLLVHTPDAWRPSELGQRFLNDLQVGFLP